MKKDCSRCKSLREKIKTLEDEIERRNRACTHPVRFENGKCVLCGHVSAYHHWKEKGVWPKEEARKRKGSFCFNGEECRD